MNGWFIEDSGFDSGQGRKNFHFSIASRLPLCSAQPHVKLVLGPFSLFLISPPPGAMVKYAC